MNKPVAWMKVFGEPIYAGAARGLAVCEAGEIGEDGKPAFPVYAQEASPREQRLTGLILKVLDVWWPFVHGTHASETARNLRKELSDAIQPGSGNETQSAPVSAPTAGEQQRNKATAANAAGQGEPIYQVRFEQSCHAHDCSKDAYHTFMPARRRIVYADRAPATSTAALDAARLDFMVQHEAWVAFGKDGESCRVFSRNEDGDAVPMLGWGARHWRHDPREAIDAAMTFVGFRAAAKGTGDL